MPVLLRADTHHRVRDKARYTTRESMSECCDVERSSGEPKALPGLLRERGDALPPAELNRRRAVGELYGELKADVDAGAGHQRGHKQCTAERTCLLTCLLVTPNTSAFTNPCAEPRLADMRKRK